MTGSLIPGRYTSVRCIGRRDAPGRTGRASAGPVGTLGFAASGARCWNSAIEVSLEGNVLSTLSRFPIVKSGGAYIMIWMIPTPRPARVSHVHDDGDPHEHDADVGEGHATVRGRPRPAHGEADGGDELVQ